MLHPLIEARLEDAEALIASMSLDDAIDNDCGEKWREAATFIQDVRNGAYANGNWR